MGKTFDQLDAIDALAASDLFVADDISESATSGVTAAQIFDYVEAQQFDGIQLNEAVELTATSTELNRFAGSEGVVVAVDSDETISAASSHTITGLVTGKRYRLELELLGAGGTLNEFFLRFGNSGGVDSGANYSWSLTSLATNSNDTGAAGAKLGDFNANDFIVVSIDFSINPSDNTKVGGFFTGKISTYSNVWGAFHYDGASAIDRVGLVSVTGGNEQTFSGRVRLYKTN